MFICNVQGIPLTWNHGEMRHFGWYTLVSKSSIVFLLLHMTFDCSAGCSDPALQVVQVAYFFPDIRSSSDCPTKISPRRLKSGDLGGHSSDPVRPSHWPGKWWSIYSRTGNAQLFVQVKESSWSLLVVLKRLMLFIQNLLKHFHWLLIFTYCKVSNDFFHVSHICLAFSALWSQFWNDCAMGYQAFFPVVVLIYLNIFL